MGRRGPPPTRDRDYVLALYRRGLLCTLQEGAWIACVTRARVGVWLRDAGIDWQSTREQHISKLRARAEAIMSGKPLKPKPTKAQQRAMGERLVAEYRRRL